MTLRSQSTEPSGCRLAGTNLRWVHMWSHRVAAIYTTESTSAMARSFITRDSRMACAEGRWKKFLSLVSPTANLSGVDPLDQRTSIIGT